MKFSLLITLAFLFGTVQAQGEKIPSPQTSPGGRVYHALTEIGGLSYRGDQETDTLQRLNLVVPKGIEQPPLLLWIGGGGWSYVNRNMEMDLVRKIAREGFAVASVGHRLSTAIFREPERTEGVQHPAHVEDIAAAFKWLYDHADEYGYNREQIFVGGFSSGGHLATLLDLDPRYLEPYGLSQANITGIIPIGGAYDIIQYRDAFVGSSRPHLVEQHVEAVFGDNEAAWLDASATEYLDQLETPILLMSENNTFNYTRRFEEAIRDTDFRNFTAVHFHLTSHGDLWRHMSYEEESRYRDYIIRFMSELVSAG